MLLWGLEVRDSDCQNKESGGYLRGCRVGCRKAAGIGQAGSLAVSRLDALGRPGDGALGWMQGAVRVAVTGWEAAKCLCDTEEQMIAGGNARKQEIASDRFEKLLRIVAK